ncbi:MAG: hypothetical protein ABSG77_13860 [Candidatus Acidiferrum sp.]|jgi:hypothetical protein
MPAHRCTPVLSAHRLEQVLTTVARNWFLASCRLVDLGDGDMIKVMADENDEIYNLTPAVINETVLAARDFLHSPAGEKEYKKLLPATGRGKDTGDGPVIAEFLDWDRQRVKEALAEISDIEEKVVEKEVIDRSWR